MKVLFVRHAQSHNNIVQARVHTKIINGVQSEQMAQQEWLSMRQDDPGLSPQGKAQLPLLANHAKKLPRKTGCTRFKIVTSPMRRACETAKAIVDVLQCSGADVQGELCEVGGVYMTQLGADGQYQKVRGNAMQAQQIIEDFGRNFNVSSLPPSGPWDGGKGFESLREAISRVDRVANWLKLPSMHEEMNQEGMLVLVSHADFLALLLAALTKESGGGGDAPSRDVSAHGVSEVTLGNSMGQKELESVYKRFRISLACTTLLEIQQDGRVNIIWMNKKSHLNPNKCAVC